MRKIIIAITLALACCTALSATQNASASNRREYREAIRSLPLIERPNRFGHIYGNTVRRLYYRKHSHMVGPAENLPAEPSDAGGLAPASSAHSSP